MPEQETPQQHVPSFLYVDGQVCHTGIHCADPGKAAQWFQAAFGWKTQEVPSEQPYHFLFDAKDAGFGGIGTLGPGFENPMILYYVQVPDLADAKKRLVAEGGSIVGDDVEIPGSGSFALFNSPGGVFAAAWETKPETLAAFKHLPPYAHERTVGVVVGRPTMAQDPKAAAAFFTKVFGWTCEERTSPTGNTVYMWSDNSGDGGVFFPASDEKQPGPVQLHILVADLAAATKKAVTAGGEKVGEPVPFGDFGKRQDVRVPTGPIVSLWQDL